MLRRFIVIHTMFKGPGFEPGPYSFVRFDICHAGA